MYTQEEKDKMAMKNSTIDKFAARGYGDGTNRGDRMVARGERKIEKGKEKIEKAAEKLGNRIENKADRAENKLERMEKRAGDFPTLGQSERISAQKSRVSKANRNESNYNEPSKLYPNTVYSPQEMRSLPDGKFNAYPSTNKAERMYNESADILVNRAKKGQARGEAKINKGERLIKKGEMLSARIKNRKG
jgi:hypothetical protein